jgi:hypothetical protein
MKAAHGVSVSLLLLILNSISLFSQIDSDRSLIWQECVNIFELQDLILGDRAAKDVPVYAVPGTVTLPDGTALNSFGRRVELVTAERIVAEGIQSYFRFEKLEISGASAMADFTFVYSDDPGAGSREIHVLAELQKTPNGWSVRVKTVEEI